MQDICRQRLVHAGTLGPPRNGGFPRQDLAFQTHHDPHAASLATPPLPPCRREPSAGGDEVTSGQSTLAANSTKKRRRGLCWSRALAGMAESSPLPSTKRRTHDWNVGIGRVWKRVPTAARLPPAHPTAPSLC